MIDERYAELVPLMENTIPVIARMGIRIVALRERYARLRLPLGQNTNHIGTVYAGSLFTLAEFSGGVIFGASFDYTRFIPIVKEVHIRYLRPARSDVTLEVELGADQVRSLAREAEAHGKADWDMDLELRDASGQVCCLVQGTWQLRRASA